MTANHFKRARKSSNDDEKKTTQSVGNEDQENQPKSSCDFSSILPIEILSDSNKFIPSLPLIINLDHNHDDTLKGLAERYFSKIDYLIKHPTTIIDEIQNLKIEENNFDSRK
jgi:hypothetical protein